MRHDDVPNILCCSWNYGLNLYVRACVCIYMLIG